LSLSIFCHHFFSFYPANLNKNTLPIVFYSINHDTILSRGNKISRNEKRENPIKPAYVKVILELIDSLKKQKVIDDWR